MCGDGLLHVGVEDCDDGNVMTDDACLTDCTAASCGDGFVHAGVEQCDDENKINADGCSKKCLLTPQKLTLTLGQPTTQYGALMSGTAFNDSCPVGQVLTGFSGSLKVGAHAAIRGMCGVPALVVEDDAFVVKLGPGGNLPQRGMVGDAPRMRPCPTDQVVVGFSGSAGTGIQQLTLSCAPLIVSEADDGTFTIGPGPVTPLMVVGNPGGVAFPQTNCPMGQVGSAQRLRASTVINAFGLGCTTVALGY